MRTLDTISAILLVIGGLNWGLVGAFRFDLVAELFGQMSTVSRIVYILVGLSALYYLLQWRAMQRRWSEPVPAARA